MKSQAQIQTPSRFSPVSVQARRTRGYKCGGALRALGLIKKLEKEGKL